MVIAQSEVSPSVVDAVQDKLPRRLTLLRQFCGHVVDTQDVQQTIQSVARGTADACVRHNSWRPAAIPALTCIP